MGGCSTFACPNEYWEHAEVDASFHLVLSNEIFISPMEQICI